MALLDLCVHFLITFVHKKRKNGSEAIAVTERKTSQVETKKKVCYKVNTDRKKERQGKEIRKRKKAINKEKENRETKTERQINGQKKKKCYLHIKRDIRELAKQFSHKHAGDLETVAGRKEQELWNREIESTPHS